MRRAVLILLLLLTDRAWSETLTLEQCLKEASVNNASLLSARQSWQASVLKVKVNEAAYYPEVAASLGAEYGAGTTPQRTKTDPNDSYSASLRISQNIFNGWLDEARTLQSEANAKSQQASYDITRAQVSTDLKTSFANLVYAQRAVRLQESIRDRRLANFNLVDLRFQNGNENKGSVLLSKAYLEQAQLAAFQAGNSIPVSRAQLARAIGRDEEADIVVSETPVPKAIPKDPNFRELAMQNPQAKKSLYDEAFAQEGIRVNQAGFYPTLSVDGSYNRADTFFFPERDEWSVGLSLNIPIFSGGSSYYGSQSAIATYSAATTQRIDLSRQLYANLKQAYARLVEAKQSVTVNESFLAAAEMRAEIGRNKYNNGLLSFDDWDVIESDLISRQQSTLQSQRDYLIAEANWENALGVGSLQ